MQPVDQVHVQVTRRPEHHRVTAGSTPRRVRGEVLRAAIGLDLDDPAAHASLGRLVDEPGSEELRGKFRGRSIEPRAIRAGRRIGRRRDHGSRRLAISSGTNGRARKPAVGMTVCRKKSTMSELFNAS